MKQVAHLQNLIQEYNRYRKSDSFTLAVEYDLKDFDELKKQVWCRKFEEVYAHAQLLKDHSFSTNEIAGFIQREIGKITFVNSRSGQTQRL